MVIFVNSNVHEASFCFAIVKKSVARNVYVPLARIVATGINPHGTVTVGKGVVYEIQIGTIHIASINMDAVRGVVNELIIRDANVQNYVSRAFIPVVDTDECWLYPPVAASPVAKVMIVYHARVQVDAVRVKLQSATLVFINQRLFQAERTALTLVGCHGVQSVAVDDAVTDCNRRRCRHFKPAIAVVVH